MLKSAWKACLSLVMLMSIAACETGRSSYIVAPDLPRYSKDFSVRAAEENDKLGPGCPRIDITEDCSALRTLLRDYFWVREQVRAGAGHIEESNP